MMNAEPKTGGTLVSHLKRRALLRWMGVLGGSLFVGSGCDNADTTLSNPTAKPTPLRAAIRKHFDYLQFDDEVIEAFERDLTRQQGPWNSRTSPRPFTRFLASTDFFQHNADENRPLRYVTFYDPYVSPCYSPFEPSEGEA